MKKRFEIEWGTNNHISKGTLRAILEKRYETAFEVHELPTEEDLKKLEDNMTEIAIAKKVRMPTPKPNKVEKLELDKPYEEPFRLLFANKLNEIIDVINEKNTLRDNL